MQYINHWTDPATLDLPAAVSKDIHQRLLEPFASEQEAKSFWQEAPSTIIILDPTDSIETVQQDETIQFALTYPEYDNPLSNGYQLLVAIVNDSEIFGVR
jgi:hypothetical protein